MGGLTVITTFRTVSKYFCIALIFGLVMLVSSAPAVTRQQYINDLISKADHYSRQEGKSLIAINYINQAVKLQSGNLDTRFNRAKIYARLKLFSEAIKDLSLVYRNAHGQKKYSKAIKYRAECYAWLGEYSRAINDYKTMLNTGWRIGKIYYYYAELLWFVGNKNEALKVINLGKLNGDHWVAKMEVLENKIYSGKRVKLHQPFSN